MDKVSYVIKLKLNEIKYDVKFDSWRKSEMASTALRNSNKDAEAMPVAYTSDDATDWLLREIDSAVADIEGELIWAVCRRTQPKTQSDAIDEVPQEWVIHFLFSPAWQGSIRTMNSLAHRYVVAKVLYRWYLAGDLRQQAADFLTEADSLLERMYMMARSERVSLEPWRL